jgi:hypothetical protein
MTFAALDPKDQAGPKVDELVKKCPYLRSSFGRPEGASLVQLRRAKHYYNHRPTLRRLRATGWTKGKVMVDERR